MIRNIWPRWVKSNREPQPRSLVSLFLAIPSRAGDRDYWCKLPDYVNYSDNFRDCPSSDKSGE